jgi:CheY-like chemotaxis protein
MGPRSDRETRSIPFDAIDSDLAMPDMDGRALLREIRGLDLDVPFVFLTGSPDLTSEPSVGVGWRLSAARLASLKAGP